MGLHQIDKFSKIRSIYLTRKIIIPHNTPKVIPRGTDTYTHLQTYRQTDKYLVEIQGFRDKLSLVARIIPFWNSPSTPSQNMSYSTHIGIQW